MFPPASPFTERTRIENEQREFDRKLEQYALLDQAGEDTSLIRRAYRWMVCRLQSRPAVAPQSRSAVLPTDPCAESFS